MPTEEYWLQKKTIGGWSHVTWYDNLEQAKRNFDNCSKANNGYSWRIAKVETVEVKMLEEVVTVEAPKVEIAAKANVWAGNEVKAAADASGWGKPDVLIPKSEWGKSSGWEKINTKSDEFWGNNPSGDRTEKQHGMTGKVWLINHLTKERARVSEDRVAEMLANGWERGGPKTGFR